MLKQVTKLLFCRKQVPGTGDDIVDGEIVTTGQNHEQIASPPCPALSPGATHGKTIDDERAAEGHSNPSRQVLTDCGIPDAYFVYLGAAGRAAGTMREYGIDLKWWQRRHGKLEELTRLHIEQTINGMHPATARRKVASLRSFAKWLLREGSDSLFVTLSQIDLPRLPGQIPRDRGAKKFKDLAAQAVDLTAQHDRRGIWLGLMLCCGLRISEIQTASPAPGGTIKIVGKGNKERLVPAPRWLRSALVRQYKNGSQWRKGRKLIWLEMKKMGITHPHSLRHTYASELVRQGFPLEQVQQLLGHARLETSLIYARVQVPKDVPRRLGVEN